MLTPLEALANQIDPDHQALVSGLLTDDYVEELVDRYPSVRRTGIASEAVVDAEIRRLERELAT